MRADEHDDEVPAWVATALVASAQALAVALIIAIGSHETGGAGYGAYLFAAASGAVLLARRRFPVAVLVVAVLGVFVYYALNYPPIGMAVPVVGAFYSAAERGRVVVAAAAGVVLLTVALYFRAADGEPSAVLAYDLLTNAALIGCAIALALAVRGGRALRNQHERLRQLERVQLEERAVHRLEAERVRIARDVHDSIGHALALVSVQARVAQQSLGTDDDAVARALDSVVDATTASLADLRGTLATLREAEGEDDRAPLTLRGIERTVQAARDAGLDVDVRLDLDDVALSAATASTAFRIVQESITNTLRHARARTALVAAQVRDGELYLSVVDDGVGAPDAGALQRGRGIAGMRERAELLGGALTAGPESTGFAVRAALPLGEDR